MMGTWWTSSLMLILAWLSLAGCGVSGDLPAVDSARGVRESQEVLAAAAPQGASTARLHGRSDSLAADVGRAIDRSGWGRLHVRGYEAHMEGSEQEGGAGRRVVHARALVANGRTAEVVVWTEASGEIIASVRVGHFGDVEAERAFLRMLGKVVTGDAAVVRKAKFELPAGWPGVEER